MKLALTDRSGFSLVEILVAAAIIGIIAIGVARLSSQVGQHQSKAAAQSFAQKQNAQLLSLIERDLSFQKDLQLGPDGLSVQITRRTNFDIDDLAGEYQITFRSQCTAFPANLRTQFERVYDAANRNKIYSHSCLQKLADTCGAGRFPEIVIEVDEADNIPAYHPRRYPDLTREQVAARVNLGAVGSGLCVERSGSNVHATIATVFLTGKSDGIEQVSIRDDERLISTGNIAGVTLLPNN